MSFNKTSTQFWTIFGNASQRSLSDIPKLLEARIISQLLSSIPVGPEPLLVLIAAFLIISLSINLNFTG